MYNNYQNFLNDTSSSSSSDEEQITLRRPKIYRRREQCFTNLDDLDFFNRFRLTKPTVLALLQQIAHLLYHPTNRSGCIEPMTQLLLTLRFFATGNILLTSGDYIGVSKTSASRIVRRVSYAIALLRPRYIKMCENNEEMRIAAEKFYVIASFPRVIGAIDCTLIKIDSPGGNDAEIFRCRKNYFALNVQTVSDADLRIRNIVARWPGSTHDQTIFNNSALKRQFERGVYGQFYLVGDSGYSLQPYLMTKLQEVHTAPENLYNESIIRTRNVVERKYGVWKRRFPILALGMRVKLSTIMTIIVATAVLHNMAVDMNEIFPNEWLNELQVEGDIPARAHDIVDGGRRVRQMIINEHFANL